MKNITIIQTQDTINYNKEDIKGKDNNIILLIPKYIDDNASGIHIKAIYPKQSLIPFPFTTIEVPK